MSNKAAENAGAFIRFIRKKNAGMNARSAVKKPGATKPKFRTTTKNTVSMPAAKSAVANFAPTNGPSSMTNGYKRKWYKR